MYSNLHTKSIIVRYLALFMVLLPLWGMVAKAQVGESIRITGRVTDSIGTPLEGVNITVVGNPASASTGADGGFQITAPSNGTLRFTNVGFISQDVAVDGRTSITVVLVEDVTSLTEVVVVGASLKQRDLTGAVVNINEATLKERPVLSINEALQGKAAGVLIQNSPQPGGNASIRIRGNNSMQYGGNPIYVVDGIVMEGDFNLLNLHDVQSINVLKDASSTALYGSRGAQGVVVVTTKKGGAGQGKVTYDGWVGVQEFVNESLTLGAKDMYELRIEALENSNTVGGNFYANNPGATHQDFLDQELFAPGKLWFADYEKTAYANGNSYNWLDAVTRRAVQQNHALGFSGGTDRSSYYLSFALNDQNGLVENSNYKSYSGRINAEQQINKWLKVGTNTSYTSGRDAYADDKVFGVARAANPLLPISADSLYLAWGNNWDINMENPLRSLTIDRERTRNKVLSANYLNVNPIEGLNIRTSFSIDVLEQKYYEYIPSDIQQAKRDSYRGRAIHNIDSRNNYQWDNSITYDKTIGEHSISGLVATSMSRNSFNYTNVTARDFPIDDFRYYNLGAAFDKPNFALGSDFVSSTLLSYLARANYSYAGKYLATVTGRFDGSSKFAKGNQWGFFPSVALGWNIAREDFLKDVEQISQLKLRFGYGNVGNQRIPDYAFYSLYNPAYSSGQVSFNSSGLRGSPDLTWENQRQLNVGVDIGLFRDRLTLTADYFDIVNSNLLMRRSLSTLTGYREAIVNIGEMTNRGVELSVNANIIRNNSFNWDLSANISTDKNTITQLYGDVDAIYAFGGFTGTDIQREGNFFLGESLNTIYMWEFDRIIQESDMDYVNSLVLPGKQLQPGDILPKDQQNPGEPGYGVIDENDRVIIGKKDPKFYGGFSSNIAYKGLSLNAVFVYSYGAKRVSGYYESLMSGTGYGPTHKDMLNRWTPTNTNTNIPRATYDNPVRFSSGETSWGIQDGSFLRLATLSLGYSLPQQVYSKAGLSGFRLYVSGNNLFTVTKYKGYDPENGDGYPTARMFVLGVNVSL
ncbi:SusC/RagA family TonB-linked outer membrane protein [Parapedobacter koreensis]|uniref:TonB-linked outer membrane protein, SusC/RagA family n=1 Tax=Parapedobacter koreensis TaxID=332977 RepID=A0A1H7SMU4_9SPHI|nr:TonB-dependent receptor [Parapedobacter koreensis]SEL73064.1 TonB-linked outer membrane protein, SusC/RagA family [Parapedobacter koreensis]